MAKKKRLTKKEALRAHARKRASERYGIEFNRHLLREIKEKICRSEVIEAKRVSCSISMFVLLLQKKQVKIIFDRSRGEVVTFLPLDAIVYDPEQKEV